MEAFSDDFTLILWVLVRLVIFSMLLERALYFIFDYKLWREWLDEGNVGIKAPLAFTAAWFACWNWDFDAVYPVLDPHAGSTGFGIFITAAIVAGGSQGAMVLFQDVLNFGRKARDDMRTLRKERRQAEIVKAKAEARKAQKILDESK